MLFDRNAGRLAPGIARRFDAARQLVARTHPGLVSVLEQAHGGGDRQTVDWKLEARAVDELGKCLEWFGAVRSGRAKSDD
jgi:hypothetical protein